MRGEKRSKNQKNSKLSRKSEWGRAEGLNRIEFKPQLGRHVSGCDKPISRLVERVQYTSQPKRCCVVECRSLPINVFFAILVSQKKKLQNQRGGHMT